MLALAILLCILAIAAYGNAVANGFVWDDHQQIVMNSSLLPGSSRLRLITTGISGSTRVGRDKANYYRPLQMVTYRLTVAVFGFNASAFHAVNLAFHAAVAILALVLFYGLAGRLRLAFASAALFAVHPIHTEAVDWIAALPDIGCTAFFLLAFLFFILTRGQQLQHQPIERSQRVPFLFLALSVVAFAAALLWKETAIVFPLIIMAWAFCLSEDPALVRRLRNALKPSLPYWCILGLYVFLRLHVLGFIVVRQRNWILSPSQLSLTVLNLIGKYCWKLFAPVGLNAYYVFDPVRTLDDPRAIAAILLLILAPAGFLYGFRRAPLATFAALWVFVTLVPVLNVYAVGRNVFCERYLYLPSIGFCLLVVLTAEWVGHGLAERFRQPVATVSLAAVLLVFTAWTFARNPIWKDDLTLFTGTLESSPNAPFVQGMVAALQPNTTVGQASAESHFLRAIALAENEVPPDRLEMAIAGEGLASIYAARHDFDRALQAIARVRVADPADPEVDGEEGLILAQAGRWTEAQGALQRAATVSPNDANVLNALGIIAWQHGGSLDEAAAYFSRALRAHAEADDFNASLHSNLGAIYGQQGRFYDAIAQFELALQITPNDPEYLTNLGTAFAAVGRIGDARTALRSALVAAPGYDPARVVLDQIRTK